MCQYRERYPERFLQAKIVGQRKGRKVELDQFDIENVNDKENENPTEITVNVKMISIIFLVTLVVVVGFCLAIISTVFKLSSKNVGKHLHIKPRTPIEGQASTGRPNTYISEPVAELGNKEPNWTWLHSYQNCG